MPSTEARLHDSFGKVCKRGEGCHILDPCYEHSDAM